MNPFAALGLAETFAIDLSAAERTYKDLVRALHPDKHVDALPTTRRESLSRAVEVNEAWRILRDPIRRAEALFLLRGVPVGDAVEPQPPAAFLMDMMDLREELASARTAADRAALDLLVARVNEEKTTALLRLAGALDASNTPTSTDLAALSELRFYTRFLEEAAAIRDEWDDGAA